MPKDVEADQAGPRAAQAEHQAFRVAVFVVLTGALLNTWPWLSGAVTVPWDSKAHFYPQLAFLARSLAEGQSPFWNPHIFAGWPQVADPQALIFAPAFLLLAALDPTPSLTAMDATVFAVLTLGALAVLAYFRDRGWPMPGATVASLAFAFGGSAAWRIQHVGQVLSLAFLPIALWLLTRALDRESARWGFAAGLAAGLVAQGRDQIALLGLYLLTGVTLAWLLGGTGRWTRLRGAVAPLSAGVLGGFLTAGLPVLLTLLLTAESNRLEISYLDAGVGSLHPAALITAAIPDLFAQADPAVVFWGPPSRAFGYHGTNLAQNMIAIYAGALPLVALLAQGLARGTLLDREIRVFAVAALLFIAYALGWNTPFFHPMYDYLPGVALFRRPADATFLIGFTLAILGGYAVNRWLTAEPAGAAARLTLAALLTLVFLVVPLGLAAYADRFREAAWPMALALLFVVASLAAMALTRPLMRRSAAAGVVLLGGVVAVDLAINNAPNESTGLPLETYELLDPATGDPVVAFLRERIDTAIDAAPGGPRRDRVELTGVDFHWPNAGMVHGIDVTLGYNPLRLELFGRATGAQDHVAVPEQREFAPLFQNYDSLMADLLGLRWVVTDVDLTQIDPTATLPEVARFGAVRIYENTGALPRALFVDGERPADFEAMIVGGVWPEGFDPGREVLLEGVTARPAGQSPPGRAWIASYANTDIVIEVQAERDGLLVLNDVWHRWWRVEIDGQAAPMLQANVIFRAVRVPAGRHLARFSFHPLSGALADMSARLGP